MKLATGNLSKSYVRKLGCNVVAFDELYIRLSFSDDIFPFVPSVTIRNKARDIGYSESIKLGFNVADTITGNCVDNSIRRRAVCIAPNVNRLLEIGYGSKSFAVENINGKIFTLFNLENFRNG